jgi:hypothetical protein
MIINGVVHIEIGTKRKATSLELRINFCVLVEGVGSTGWFGVVLYQ